MTTDIYSDPRHTDDLVDQGGMLSDDAEKTYSDEHGHEPKSNFDDPNLTADGCLQGDSPYPEVRSAVANTDDTSIPSSTG
uniref:Uncharacterized protein n=1 Tax=Psilocybe cubensis TaxID=181762 RepID=A0A8H8CFP0_PSICU